MQAYLSCIIVESGEPTIVTPRVLLLLLRCEIEVREGREARLTMRSLAEQGLALAVWEASAQSVETGQPR